MSRYETHSGIPAFSNEARLFYQRKINHFYDSISHLKRDNDFAKLLIPSLQDYLKHDIKNSCNPLHLELLTCKSKEDEQEKMNYETECRFKRKEITELQYKQIKNQLELYTLNKLFYFGDVANNILPMSKDTKNKILQIKKELSKDAEEKQSSEETIENRNSPESDASKCSIEQSTCKE